MDKTGYMRRAIALCRQKMAEGVGGYCASLIVKDGEVVGEGWNNVVENHDPAGHCEINAMRAAGQRLGTWNLSGCELYTTWEPCPMCAAAIWWARLDRVYYANLLSDGAAFGLDLEPLYHEVRLPSEQRPRPYERLLGAEAFAVLRAWWDESEREVI